MPKYKIVTIIVMFLVVAWQISAISSSDTTYKKAIYAPSENTTTGKGGYVFGNSGGKGFVFGGPASGNFAKDKATATHNNNVRNSLIISLATLAAGGLVLAYKREAKKEL